MRSSLFYQLSLFIFFPPYFQLCAALDTYSSCIAPQSSLHPGHSKCQWLSCTNDGTGEIGSGLCAFVMSCPLAPSSPAPSSVSASERLRSQTLLDSCRAELASLSSNLRANRALLPPDHLSSFDAPLRLTWIFH